MSARIIESIPTDLKLREYNEKNHIKNHGYTENALIELVNNTKSTLDITVMYWSLFPQHSGKCIGKNCKQFTTEKKCNNAPECKFDFFFTNTEYQNMNSEWGANLYNALEHALQRKVQMRIIQSPGFGGIDEGLQLQTKYPQLLQINLCNMKPPPPTINNSFQNQELLSVEYFTPTNKNSWYGGGIMHQKIWISDNKTFYLGSANMDWLSLAQVKELGVMVSSSQICSDLTTYFNGWWKFSSPNLTGYKTTNGKISLVRPTYDNKQLSEGQPPTKIIYDQNIAANRQVPIWASPNIKNYLDPILQYKTKYNWNNPMDVMLNEENC